MAEVTAQLAMRGVSKRFGAVQALHEVDLSVQPGEVHALIGENGAGKSTLMRILAGALAADSGRIELAGQPYAPPDPHAARHAGVAMIYQELSLAPHLSVEEDILLGIEPRRFGLLRRSQLRQRAHQVLELLQHAELTPARKVGALSPGARQLVEVARALATDARVVVMDEPTSALASHEVERLPEVVARLRTRGVSVIFISHVLEELERIADRYTVLRDGRSVATGSLAGTTRAQLVEAMVGRSLSEIFPRVEHSIGAPVLELRALAGRRLPHEASCVLRRGEIFGIAGLMGAGRSELLRALFGLEPIAAGEVRVAAASDRGHPPWIRRQQRIGLVSEQRKEEGVALALSVTENLTLPVLGRVSRAGLVRPRAQRALAQQHCDALGVRCADLSQPIAALSGGNQQKVALARLLACDAQILLLDEPTRGIDVGSKAEIYRRIGELARGGKAVLMVSSHLPELLGVCDTIAVMRRGRLGAARPVQAWTQAELMQEALGDA